MTKIKGDVNTIKFKLGGWNVGGCELCDTKAPFKLKGKFYRITLRPVMYGTKCCSIYRTNISVTEMRCLVGFVVKLDEIGLWQH